MGFTHYWYRHVEIEVTVFSRIMTDIRKVVEAAENQGIALADGTGHGKPAININYISINGYGEFASNEEFFLSRLFKKDRPLIPSEDGLYPGFCKTAQKPYDVAVTACLIVAKHHLADQFKVSSDGDDNDWVQGRTLCQEVLGYGANFSLGSDKI